LRSKKRVFARTALANTPPAPAPCLANGQDRSGLYRVPIDRFDLRKLDLQVFGMAWPTVVRRIVDLDRIACLADTDRHHVADAERLGALAARSPIDATKWPPEDRQVVVYRIRHLFGLRARATRRLIER
jgi:hypothetical protein